MYNVIMVSQGLYTIEMWKEDTQIFVSCVGRLIAICSEFLRYWSYFYFILFCFILYLLLKLNMRLAQVISMSP